MQIGGFILDEISSSQKKVRLCLNERNNTEKVIFDLKDVFFLLNNRYNLVGLALLNNHDIFHNNNNKTFYNLKTKKVLA